MSDQQELADWAGDIVALVTHLESALDHHKELEITDPETKKFVQHLHDTVRDNKKAAESFQKTLGSTPGNPVIQAATDVLGKGAGLIGKMRTDSVSKALRDDYTALNHVAIAYTMFYTTAKAFKNDEAATFAERGLTTYARLIQGVNQIMPQAMMHDFAKNDDLPPLNPQIVKETRAMVDAAWKATAN